MENMHFIIMFWHYLPSGLLVVQRPWAGAFPRHTPPSHSVLRGLKCVDKVFFFPCFSAFPLHRGLKNACSAEVCCRALGCVVVVSGRGVVLWREGCRKEGMPGQPWTMRTRRRTPLCRGGRGASKPAHADKEWLALFWLGTARSLDGARCASIIPAQGTYG